MAGGCRLHRRVGQFKVDDPGHYYSVANNLPAIVEWLLKKTGRGDKHGNTFSGRSQ